MQRIIDHGHVLRTIEYVLWSTERVRGMGAGGEGAVARMEGGRREVDGEGWEEGGRWGRSTHKSFKTNKRVDESRTSSVCVRTGP